MLSTEFANDLHEVDQLLDKVDQRLESLHDLAVYEELPADVPRRLVNRRNALTLFRTQLGEIPELAGGAVQ
jgi:hypothetical protein